MKFTKLASIFVFATCLVFACTVIPGFAQDKTWSYNGVEYRLPKPIEQIQIPSDIPEYHTVVPGDCLWFISQRYLTDPFLWPLIWEENLDTVNNPHLIYPDQQIKLPGGTMVAATDSGLPTEGRPDTGMGEEGDDEEMTGDEYEEGMFTGKAKEPEPYEVTSRTYMVSSGYISPDQLDGPKIVGAETEAFDLSLGDIVFFTDGVKRNVEPEDEFYTIRKVSKVYHPISNKFLGYKYHITGAVKSICINDDFSSASVTESFTAILRGDILIPKVDIPIPVTLGSPATDPCNPSTKQLPGTIVDAYIGETKFSDAVIIAEGDIAYLDLGSKDGVAPGDYFTIFKHNMNDMSLPRYVAGELMVIKVAETTSTAVLTDTKTAVFIGDQIELKQ